MKFSKWCQEAERSNESEYGCKTSYELLHDFHLAYHSYFLYKWEIYLGGLGGCGGEMFVRDDEIIGRTTDFFS